jgi:hypothetical protein
MRKRRGSRFLAPCLTLLALSAATAQGAADNSGAFLTWGGITYVTHADGVSTGYTVDLGLPPLPDPSTLGGLTVQVTGPNGFTQAYAAGTPHLYTWMGNAEIWQEFPALAPGLYTFTVSDGAGTRSTRTELLSAPQLMPVVDVSTLQWSRRSAGGYRFTWRPVASEKPYYYRLTIIDADGNDIYSGERKFDSAEEIVPGVLTDGAQYQARVEVHDAPNFDLVNNRSNSAWVTFTPAATDYDPNRVVSNYAFVVNRYTSSGLVTDFNFGLALANPGLTSATVSGPNGFSYLFDLAASRLKPRVPETNSSASDYYKQWPTALTPGPYVFEFNLNGVVQRSYASLPPAVTLPSIDESTLAVRKVDSGTARFSWADPDHTGALYYRVMIQDSDGKYYSSARVNQTFIDVPLDHFAALNANMQWRVEIFDSSSGIAVRNRRSGNYRPLLLEPYPASALWIDSCQIAHVVNYNGAHQTLLQALVTSSGSLTELTMQGSNGFSRDLLARNGFREEGSPAPGLYRCSATDGSGKSAVAYNYQPAAHALSPVDLKSVNINRDPSAALQISWAPVSSELPLWYAVRFFRNSRVDGQIRETQFFPLVLPERPFLQQTSLTIPPYAIPQEPFSMRIFAFDGGDVTTYNNYSRSLSFGYQGAGFDYAGLTDSDGDGYLSNITPEATWGVSVQTSGSGSGSIHSDPPGISCASGSNSGCSGVFGGPSVTLVATPGIGSTFAGWQGACASQGASCTVTLKAAASATALFSSAPFVKLVGDTTREFPTIASAYLAAMSGNTIRLREGEFSEAPQFNRPLQVKISGGYDASFTSATGSSAVHGPLRVSDGKLTAERIGIR